MPEHPTAQGGFQSLAEALYRFAADQKRQADLCMQYEATSAIHGDGSRYELYRMYPCNSDLIDCLRANTNALRGWDSACLWDFEGMKWEKLERDVRARMAKHGKLEPIITRGIEWKNRPFLIHAYKFSTDPRMKVELLLPDSQFSKPEFSLRAVSMGLELHEFLLPEYRAKALPSYAGHEASFLTLREYLSQRLPKDLYNLCCFPPLQNDSC